MKRSFLFAVLALMLTVASCQHRPSSATFSPTGEPSEVVDFNHAPGGWCKFRSEPWGDYYCTGGELHLINRAANSSGQRITPMGGGTHRNFMFEATMRSVSDTGSYGVFFRGADAPICCYIFRVRPAGDFQLLIAGGKDAVLWPWTASTAVHKGGAVNVLQVQAQGSRIILFANGEELASLDNGVLSEGSIGLVTSEDSHAAGSSLKIWELP